MANPLAKIFKSSGIFSGPSESAVGIDVGTSAIKVVEIKRKGGRAVLETYGAISLGPYAGADVGRVTNLPIEKITEALKEVLKQAGVSSSSAGFSIPVRESLIFTLELPGQTKPEQIPAIVPTEARKYIPVPITEVTLDYFVLPKKEQSHEEASTPLGGESGKTEVLVVALQNESVSRFRSLVSETSLNASFFEIEIFATIRSTFEHELSLVLLLDFGASSTKLTLVEFGTVRSYHTIARGGADITDSIATSLGVTFSEAEKVKKESGLSKNAAEKNVADIIRTHVDYIFAEANTVLLAYEQKYGRTVSKVILSGGGALLHGLSEAAAENFRAEIELGEPFRKVNAPAFLDKVLAATGPEFAVALGLALRKLEK
ncbi:MAG: type IV pilus assembly protein PilM [Patescibacteria group bacterium]